MSIFERVQRLFERNVEPGVAIEPVVFPRTPLTYPEDVYAIPVVIVSYFPTGGSGQIDRSLTGDVGGPLAELRRHTEDVTRRVVEALELGSIYHGYRAPGAQPGLRYRVIDKIEFAEPMPTWQKPGHRVPMVDYAAIVERIEIGRRIREEGVKEVWIWGYHGGVVDLWESNMSGPFGDVSNSDGDPGDLPVFDSTYTVYHYNYGRGASEAVEDHVHQIEAVLRQVDPGLFWDRFVGKPGDGRCGWAHFPPNGEHDYDWANQKMVATDIEGWQPAGGRRTRLNARRWRNDSLTWFIYWMENLPGRGNALRFGDRPLTNWWRFIGDWDGAMREGMGLAGKRLT